MKESADDYGVWLFKCDWCGDTAHSEDMGVIGDLRGHSWCAEEERKEGNLL